MSTTHTDVYTETHSEYDRERSSGFRQEPAPGKGFEDFDRGDMVPVPRYFGTLTWVFPIGEVAP